MVARETKIVDLFGWAFCLWVGAVCLVVDGEAQAQTVVVLDMPGRAGKANTGLLRGELESRGLYTVYAQNWFYDRARDRSLSVDGLLDVPDDIVAASDGAVGDRVDAIVGPVSSTRKGLVIEVYNASTGTAVGTLTLPLRRGKLVGRTTRKQIPELEALIDLTGWPEAEMSFETDNEPSLGALTDPTEEFPDDSGAVSPFDGAWFEVQTGISMVKRDFTLQSSTEELTYSSSFYPGIYLGGDAYPLMNVYGDKWWTRFGLAGHFMRGFDDVEIDGGTGPSTVPVTHQDFGVGVVYRYTLQDNLTLRFGSGWDFVDFVLADNPFYSSTTYRGFWVATHALYQWTDKLAARGGLQVLPVVGLSESEGDFGEDSSTFGFAMDARIQYALFSGLHAQLGWRLLVFQSSFDGVGLRRLEQVETTDVFNDLSLWLGYEL